MPTTNLEYEALPEYDRYALTHYSPSVFRNGTFIFEVGGNRFTVHRDLVARNSEALKAMMEGGMQESRKGSAPLQNTDELTFGRFVEFMYTGDYNPAEPVDRSATPLAVEGETNGAECSPPAVGVDAPAGNFWGDGAIRSPEAGDWPTDPQTAPPLTFELCNQMSSRKKARKTVSTRLERASLKSDIRVQDPLPTQSLFETDGGWNLDYLPLFLSHSQLYVFADTYGIPYLQNLAAARLNDALSRFRYSQNSNTDVVQLVSYAYENTTDRSDGVDNLRMVVTHFCATNIGKLRTSKNFLGLLENGGPFVPALVSKMCDVLGVIAD